MASSRRVQDAWWRIPKVTDIHGRPDLVDCAIISLVLMIDTIPSDSGSSGVIRRSVAVALAIGLTLLGVALIVVPTHSPYTLIGTNAIRGSDYIELEEKGKLESCQSTGTIPRDTSAIRLGIEGLYFSPAVTIKISADSHLLREAAHRPGGPSAPTVTVPVERLTHAVNAASICIAVGPAREPIRYYGAPKHSSIPHANQLQEAVLQMQYLRPGTKSWWSMTSSIAYHMGLGRAPSGTWIVFLVIALMLAVVFISARLTLEELR